MAASDGGAPAGVGGWQNFAKAMGELPFAETAIARQQRNLDVLYKANLAAISGAQALVNHQFDFARETIGEFVTMFQNLLSPYVSANDRLAKQAQHSKQVVEKGFASVRELGEILGNAQSEALGLINQNVVDGLDEIRGYWHAGSERAAAE